MCRCVWVGVYGRMCVCAGEYMYVSGYVCLSVFECMCVRV